VQQVRLQSTTQDNVVNYTVVITVKNETGKLLPGMTATVQFQTGAANNVLTVPNAALRIKPTPAMLAAAGISGQSATPRDSTARASSTSSTSSMSSTSSTSSTNLRSSNASAGSTGRGTGQARPSGARSGSGAMLWTVDSTGKVKPVRVRTGVTDGQKTEVQGTALAEGTQVIVSVAATTGAASTAPAANPFQPQRPQGGGRGF
jgi:HlyD family secretion protein